MGLERKCLERLASRRMGSCDKTLDVHFWVASVRDAHLDLLKRT